MNEAKRFKTIFLTALSDLLALLLGWLAYLYLGSSFELTELGLLKLNEPMLALLHSAYWLGVFGISGLYKNLFLISRLDESIKVIKTVVFGVLILFFIVIGFNLVQPVNPLHTSLSYGLFTFLGVVMERFLLRSGQRALAIRGRGLHRSLIIGTGDSAESVFKDLQRNKTLGHDVLGFVRVNGESAGPIAEKNILGTMAELTQLVKQYQVQDVIIALEPYQRDELVKLLSKMEVGDLSIKIVPDFHQVVSGLNKTNQIFGLALIELNPDPMPLWEKVIKRLMDIVISLLLLFLTLPITLIVSIIIKNTSSGPVIFAQKRVGRFSKEFTMYKFRTMFENAEKKTGPVWAQKDDPRITPVGAWLRKLRIDEIPQFVNVLNGQMSLVGPRPERKHFVDQFISEIPMYSRRLRVRPGITGWAQVKWKYDATLEDVKEKTKYDLFYVENRSLRMDLKILINTLLVVIKGKGQ